MVYGPCWYRNNRFPHVPPDFGTHSTFFFIAAQALSASLAFILLGLGAAQQHKTNTYENTLIDALEGNQQYKSRSMNDHRPCQCMSMYANVTITCPNRLTKMFHRLVLDILVYPSYKAYMIIHVYNVHTDFRPVFLVFSHIWTTVYNATVNWSSLCDWHSVTFSDHPFTGIIPPEWHHYTPSSPSPPPSALS